jgi:predicted RNA binding protein YcfA (HicA-like mRNA interferase family)
LSDRLPTITAIELVTALQKHGFVKARQSGSHIIFKHADGRRTTVPMHKGKDLGRGLLKQIMRDANLSIADIKRAK